MKNRFLITGLIALVVGACGDDVQIVEPTPPPTPPVTATMAPASATVAVGNSVVFAVNASGGAAGAAATWTCASSNTGIATASTTSVGCQATGVAAGGVTITAVVTKGSETVNVGARLTVTSEEEQAGDPAFILISSIDDRDEDDSVLTGSVEVVVGVERGDQTLEMLSLLVDGAVVAHQSFGGGMGMAPPEDEAAEQAVHSFTLSFNSSGYGDDGTPDYMNAEHTISAELQIAGGTISSNGVPVEFSNPDGVHVAVSGLGAGAMNSTTGQVWYGGPLAMIEITAVPVMYSGGSTASVGIGAFCGDEDGATATAAPFVLTPECEGTGEHTATFTADGAVIDVLNSDVFPLWLDYAGPSAPIFSPNPNGREDGWVNLTVDFGGEQGSRNKDGWLTFNDEDDSGVGGYQPVLRYAEDDDIEDARAAAPLSPANRPGESDANAYCVVASAVDLLGNESSLPGDIDDGDCLIAGTPDTDDTDPNNDGTGYQMLLEELRVANAMMDDGEGVTTKADAIETAMDELADAGLLVGVDSTPPGIELDDDTRFNTGDPSLAFAVYDDENEDSNSDLHTLPLLVTAQIRDTDDTDCLDIADGTDGGTAGAVGTTSDDCDDPTPLAENTAVGFAGPANAYYTVRGAALDKAGNHSVPLSHTFVFDDEIATSTAPAAPRIEAGEVFDVASFLNDNLSIRDYYVTANFAAVGSGAIELGVVPPTAVDAFDADPLTYRNKTVSATVDTYMGLQENPAATTVTTLTGVSVAVRDQADSDGTNDGTPGTTTFTVAETVDDGFENEFGIVFTTSEAAVCAAEDTDDCADEAEPETELKFVATATDLGSFSDPFDRVDFWVQDVNGASWMLGSDTSGESDRVSSDNRRRTWTYSLDASGAALYMLTREAGFPPDLDSDEHTVRAFGVNDDGIALVQSVTIDIDDGESNR